MRPDFPSGLMILGEPSFPLGSEPGMRALSASYSMYPTGRCDLHSILSLASSSHRTPGPGRSLVAWPRQGLHASTLRHRPAAQSTHARRPTRHENDAHEPTYARRPFRVTCTGRLVASLAHRPSETPTGSTVHRSAGGSWGSPVVIPAKALDRGLHELACAPPRPAPHRLPKLAPSRLSLLVPTRDVARRGERWPVIVHASTTG
nr:hypothetical protein CFP56_19346 [Quercus suber]